MYDLCRSWVKNFPANTVPPGPGSPPPQVLLRARRCVHCLLRHRLVLTSPCMCGQLLRSPLPQSELTRRRLPRRPQQTPKDIILNSAPSVSAEALLSSHIAYSREIKKWWQTKRCHRLARYRDRLRQLNVTVDAAGEVHLLHDVGCVVAFLCSLFRSPPQRSPVRRWLCNQGEEGVQLQSPIAFTGSPPIPQVKTMSFGAHGGMATPGGVQGGTQLHSTQMPAGVSPALSLSTPPAAGSTAPQLDGRAVAAGARLSAQGAADGHAAQVAVPSHAPVLAAGAVAAGHAQGGGGHGVVPRRESLDAAGLASIAGDLVSLASGLPETVQFPAGLASPSKRE